MPASTEGTTNVPEGNEQPLEIIIYDAQVSMVQGESMVVFTHNDLELLTQERTGRCVSLYLRTQVTGSEVLQDPISFNTMLTVVQQELVAQGMHPPEARNFTRPARALGSDQAFWQLQSKGLAVFLADGFFRAYRLPIPCKDLLIVNGRFHLTPLLTLLTEDTEYYLLVLSQSRIRLFRGGRFGLEKVMVPGVPEGMNEVVSQDQNEAFPQYPVRSGSGAGRRTMMSPARGEGRDDANMSRYFPQVNEGIHGLLQEKNTPLVVAGVDYLLHLYRQANTYPGLLPGGISGDVDALRAEALHEKAWPVVEPLFRRKREEAREACRALRGTAKASIVTAEIVPASYQGRVSTLLLSGRKHEWGTVDRSKGGTVSHVCRREEEGCEDLYEFAAIQTLLKGGKVFIAESDAVVDGAAIAARFRR